MGKLKLLAIVVFAVLSGFSFGAGNENIKGTWTIEVTGAPVEYSKSTMTVSENEGVLNAKIIFSDGSVLNASKVSCQGENFKLSVVIEGYDVAFTGTIAGDKLTGSVETPDGSMIATGNKISLMGKWNYKSPDAPAEYSEGKLIFGESAGKTTLNLLIGGYDVPVSNLKVTNGIEFSFTVGIEGETVSVNGYQVGDKIKAKASSSQGEVSITATQDKN